ncbi:MAG: 5-bromo-4-chloroindolyl phosphate hydrolysis family protein [Geminicoccaceae bacterium]|nr:5-bromo-4-chloroindolyl phosphate hydrolysis family protein [Geminicoccaceae bacterium]MCX7630968.1 5-bromo-4-chloroindolyl phosphate hydrolysis family protein [Geminicoccaceae bacterium]MDW8124714.1 5-bromo-4-chloroindolyl phosphate hydrolysis family protein [Geminicoccaceae bacterium]
MAPLPRARRIGGTTEAAAGDLAPSTFRRAWILRIFAGLFLWPLVLRLLGFDGGPALALVLGIALLWVAARLVERGLAVEAELAGRRLARAPRLPLKLAGALVAAAAAGIVGLFATPGGPLLALVYAGLTFLGCRLAYGADPRTDRHAVAAAADRAGMRPAEVLAVLEEANGKIRGIEEAARVLRSRELRERIARIAELARAVLRELERDPRDISRARRFLATYLDGTRDVIAKFAEQQHEVEDSPLGENFRRLLETIERVFGEQLELLRRDDRLDLEVQLEVLETQLRREGVH